MHLIMCEQLGNDWRAIDPLVKINSMRLAVLIPQGKGLSAERSPRQTAERCRKSERANDVAGFLEGALSNQDISVAPPACTGVIVERICQCRALKDWRLCL